LRQWIAGRSPFEFVEGDEPWQDFGDARIQQSLEPDGFLKGFGRIIFVESPFLRDRSARTSLSKLFKR
jgi:hypothetical protein